MRQNSTHKLKKAIETANSYVNSNLVIKGPVPEIKFTKPRVPRKEDLDFSEKVNIRAEDLRGERLGDNDKVKSNK